MSENGAFGCSYGHCFHVVQSCSWSKLWSSPFRWDMDAIRKSKIRFRLNSFSVVIIPYLERIVKSLLLTRKFCGAVVKENARRKKLALFSRKCWTLSLLWYVVVLTGGTIYEKYDKRAMARKHHSARGQQTDHTRNEATAGIHQSAQH